VRLTHKQLDTLIKLLDAPIKASDALLRSWEPIADSEETSKAYIAQVWEGNRLKALRHQLEVEWDESPVGDVKDACLKEFGAYGACMLRKDHTTKMCRDAVGNRFMGRTPISIAQWHAQQEREVR
jgi:hypothetical protein